MTLDTPAPETSADSMAEHRGAVVGFLRRLVGDPALAEDLAQETFLRAQRSAASRRGEAGERTWLCAIALNLARDHFRAAGRRPRVTADARAAAEVACDADVEKALLEAEMAACIGEYLFRLPRPRRDVVALHDMAGLGHREIGAALGLSEANSRVLLHRGRAALRALLERDCNLSFREAIPCERKPRARP